MTIRVNVGQQTNDRIKLNTDYPQWLTFRQFCSVFPWPTESGLRALKYGAFIGKNSFKSAFRKVGRRVLVNPACLFRAIDELNNHSVSDQKGGTLQ